MRAKDRDVQALVELNDALYTSCLECHIHYPPRAMAADLRALVGARYVLLLWLALALPTGEAIAQEGGSGG